MRRPERPVTVRGEVTGLTTTTWPGRQETGMPPAEKHRFWAGNPGTPGNRAILAHSLADLVRRSVRSSTDRS